jgi:hypothetical protein
VPVYGYVTGNPVPAQKHIGTVIDVLSERSPVDFDYATSATYNPSSGVTQAGWTIHAQKNERFAYTVTRGGFIFNMRLRVYGPIHDCQGASTGEASLNAERGTWTAPDDGDYFVAPYYGLWRTVEGQIRLVDFSSSPLPSAADTRASFRRLLPDGTFAGHTLVETSAGWHFYDVQDALITQLNGTTAIVAAGTYLVGQYSPTKEPRLVIARPGALDSPIELAAPQLTGALVVADFTNDGLTDILWGRNLYVAQNDGSFTPSSLQYTNYEDNRAVVAADMDGDGWQDILFVQIKAGFAFYATPYFRRGAAFVPGVLRVAMSPITPSFSEPAHAGLVDVTGNGEPELVIGIRGPQGPSPSERILAYQLPHWVDADGAANPASQPSIQLVEVAASPARLPSFFELDRTGPRLTDLDGDGIADWFGAARFQWSQEVLYLFYGNAQGGIDLPWEYVSASQLGSDSPVVDHGDFDGDGCVDVLVGGAGLSLFRGVRCQQR